MRRRDFTVGLLFAAAARTAGAQQPEGKHRIVIIDPAVPADQISETGGYFYWRAFFAELRRLLDKSRLPASFFWDDIVKEGGLMSYGDDLRDLFRRWADIVHRVLTGTKPGDIPIAQPTKFVFAINLRTAKALGLTIPPLLLAGADEVIE